MYARKTEVCAKYVIVINAASTPVIQDTPLMEPAVYLPCFAHQAITAALVGAGGQVTRDQAGALQAAEDRVATLAARLPAASVVRELLQGSELLAHAKVINGHLLITKVLGVALLLLVRNVVMQKPLVSTGEALPHKSVPPLHMLSSCRTCVPGLSPHMPPGRVRWSGWRWLCRAWQLSCRGHSRSVMQRCRYVWRARC
jgi:hypothetical protein